MVPKSSFPPTHTHAHLTTVLPPSTAQTHLTNFLTRTQKKPHLHPDSLLSTAGITYSAHSGPSGGLALHHLRRIEAGLRGENLMLESEEELKRLFDEEDVDGEGEKGVWDGRGVKRKREKERSMREIGDWAEDSSSQVAVAVAAEAGAGTTQQELESFANTPMYEQDWQQEQEGQSFLEGELEENGGVKKSKTAAEREARRAAKKARRVERARAEGKG